MTEDTKLVVSIAAVSVVAAYAVFTGVKAFAKTIKAENRIKNAASNEETNAPIPTPYDQLLFQDYVNNPSSMI